LRKSTSSTVAACRGFAMRARASNRVCWRSGPPGRPTVSHSACSRRGFLDWPRIAEPAVPSGLVRAGDPVLDGSAGDFSH
jgi:hypothetical protein